MKVRHIIGFILSLIPLPILLYYLNSRDLIDWKLAVTLVFVEVPIGVLFHFFTKEKKTGRLEIHSKNLVKEFTILSKGDFRPVENGISEFHVPYPYEEYVKYLRRIDHPTHREIIDSFNKSDWSETGRYYDFVLLKDSPEGKFQQAINHLKSYKDIHSKFEVAKKERENYTKFIRTYDKQIAEIFEKIKKLENMEQDSIYMQYSESLKKYSDSLESLQSSLEILSQQLEHGEIIKGKCELGY